MTYQCKKAVVSLISNVIVFFILFNKLNVLANGDSQVWGKFFLYLLGVMVATNIVVTLVFNIIHNTFSKYTAPITQDERDQTIELKSVRNFCFLLSFGFFVSMAALAFQQPITTMFAVMAMTVLAASIALYASYIFYYQRGY